MVIILAAAGVGSLLTNPDPIWYDSLIKSVLNPPPWVFAPVWTLLYALLIYAAWLLGRNVSEKGIRFWFVVYLFGFNLILNGVWSYLFFTEHLLGAAMIDAAVLAVSAWLIAFLAWPINRRVTSIFLLYAGWLSFATVLSYNLWQLN
jgi:tryptophan-rich sensory protein